MKAVKQSDKLLDNAKRIHMIGIGGSGMCPLAEVLSTKGYTVSGSDTVETAKTEYLRGLGITVFIGQKPENVEGADLVAYSAAIPETNPERKAAAKKGIPTMERSVLLGALTRQYENCIGVAGTHGKTTVSSIITQILLLNKREPTAVIGGTLPIAGSSAVIGDSDILVCESCEFVNSFLEFSPDISVLLNIDNDHLDFFGNMENLAKSFREFVSLSKVSYVNGDSQTVIDTVSGLDTKIITFGKQKNNDFYADNIKMGKYGYCFDVYKNGEKIGSLSMHIPGEHNIYNGLVSFAVCYDLGVSPEGIAEAVSKFTGAGRRFESYGTFSGIQVIDDYAHHPTEIEATIKAAKSLTDGKVTVVFQPFTYSRVALLKDGMIKALSHADKVFLTPIVASREENIYGVSSSDIANALPDAQVVEDYELLTEKMINSAQSGDILITMGAGDIYKVAERISEKLNENG
ncbi:MAG TPA: UDP-N-acetylmuramate--L-alanine ligase [Ruminococcaceae bacterium]|nr:UDP-N-acetylmuramate--L-alanine ligase [Oscillospiraceae bacterium]